MWRNVANFTNDESITSMKKYFIEFIASAIAYLLLSVVLDAIFNRIDTVGHYLVSALIFGLLWPLFMALFEIFKNRNSSK